MDITRADLLITTGIAAATGILLQLLIKPWLSKRYIDKWWHDWALNIAATILAIGLAVLGLYVNNLIGEPQGIAFAFVQGAAAAFLSVYGYEMLKNAFKFVGHNSPEA